MKNKHFFITTTFTLGFLFLVGCTTNNKDYSVTYNDVTKEEFEKEPDESKLKYYTSLEEAIISNEFDGDEHVTNVKKIIKVLKKDRDCLVLFITKLDSQDFLVSYKLRIKETKGNIEYSTPCYAMMRAWKLDKDMIKQIINQPTSKETLIEKVDSDLLLNNYLGTFDIGDNNKVAWGLWNSKLIYSLKIDGTSPTGVIELEMDGDKVYLWYYDNLRLDSSDFDKKLITVK